MPVTVEKHGLIACRSAEHAVRQAISAKSTSWPPPHSERLLDRDYYEVFDYERLDSAVPTVPLRASLAQDQARQAPQRCRAMTVRGAFANVRPHLAEGTRARFEANYTGYDAREQLGGTRLARHSEHALITTLMGTLNPHVSDYQLLGTDWAAYRVHRPSSIGYRVFADCTCAGQNTSVETRLIPPSVKTDRLDPLRRTCANGVRPCYLLANVAPAPNSQQNATETRCCSVRSMAALPLNWSARTDPPTDISCHQLKPIDSGRQTRDTTKPKKAHRAGRTNFTRRPRQAARLPTGAGAPPGAANYGPEAQQAR